MLCDYESGHVELCSSQNFFGVRQYSTCKLDLQMWKSNMKRAMVNCSNYAMSPVFYRPSLAQRSMRLTSVDMSQASHVKYNNNALVFYKKLLHDI